MAGALFLGPELTWSTSSGIFYWVVDTLAAVVTDETLAQRLREVSEYNLGAVDLEKLDARERAELMRAIARLTEVAERTLPESEGRAGVLAQIADLAALAARIR